LRFAGARLICLKTGYLYATDLLDVSDNRRAIRFHRSKPTLSSRE